MSWLLRLITWSTYFVWCSSFWLCDFPTLQHWNGVVSLICQVALPSPRPTFNHISAIQNIFLIHHVAVGSSAGLLVTLLISPTPFLLSCFALRWIASGKDHLPSAFVKVLAYFSYSSLKMCQRVVWAWVFTCWVTDLKLMVLIWAEFAYGFDWTLADLFKMVMNVLLETVLNSGG